MRTGHVQAQGVVDTLEDPLLVLDGGLNVSAINPAFLRTFDVERDEVMGQNLLELGEGVWNSAELRQLISGVIPKAHAILDYEIRTDLPQHGPRTYLLSARRLVHPDHRSASLLLTFRDVTESSRATAESDTLLAEAQHRTKNLLGIVRGLVHQTTTAGISAASYKEIILGRLAVIGAAQELEREYAGSVGLRALAERVLAPFLDQVRIGPGPEIELAQRQILPMSLVLHELSTNAVKYGCLSNSVGTVTLNWTLSEPGPAPHLVLDWTEDGGPPVSAPERTGFGSQLIAGSVTSNLSGRVEQRYEAKGLQVRIEFPLA